MNEWGPLPELQPPAGVENCSLCQLALQRPRVIWGEGSPSAPVMIVLDNPGAREDREGNPFVCGTRQALQTVLGNPLPEVKALRGSVLTHAGLPAVCSYHPLAARRRPNLMPLLIEDLRLAARVAFQA